MEHKYFESVGVNGLFLLMLQICITLNIHWDIDVKEFMNFSSSVSLF